MNDVDAIRQLVALCGRAGDDDDVESWLACFTPDGSFGRSDTDVVHRGHDALRAMFTTYPVHGRHTTSDHIVDVDGDNASLTCYLTFLDAEHGFALRMFGIYHDVLVRTPSGWLLRDRRLEVVHEAT
ncbi:hypothetical protein AX769_07355 [Frondihabitans sp. PAMC 28766]|uniref:nuclear transport factor 2 family protein n=1 Tax=Frondihabitans sp. PAMC 28766 TaxID=1795630 RepID=UPI00078D6B66|nr:nuclear transport factor 2 family protein [Frondihabitans sp. PAMC 28766]AMM20013.1 hypothetical protein AX769_07355 [Frondihabitans sp. PAMC 28766]